jgi:ABC-type dipeptide/oligopeptide/nickel transport system permease component
MNLLKYVLKRLGWACVTIWALFTLTFILMRSVPGDPFTKTKEIPAETMANLQAKYGLDKPLVEQYFIQLKKIFIEFNLGESFRTIGREVNQIIKDQFYVSATIGIIAVIFGITVGLILGSVAALKRNSIIDRSAMFLCVLGLALPSFIFAYLFQYFFALVPLTVWGINPDNWVRTSGWGEPRDVILPAFTLSLGIITAVTRLMRSQMVEVSFAEFIKTAKAKGMPTLRMVLLHQVRNAILPVISIAGPILVFTMSGALIIENIFGIPGLGRTYITSIQNSDYNVIMGLTVFFGSFFILMNLLTDIIYSLVDPRIRVE